MRRPGAELIEFSALVRSARAFPHPARASRFGPKSRRLFTPIPRPRLGHHYGLALTAGARSGGRGEPEIERGLQSPRRDPLAIHDKSPRM